MEWPEDYIERVDPVQPIQEHLSIYLERLPANHIEILDVGSGPLTKLGKVSSTKSLSITAVDVLAAEYDKLLKQFSVTPLVRTQPGQAEKLTQQFGAGTFDIVHAQNSIDHTTDPLVALREMLTVSKPGGYVVLLHAENEGKNENYRQLHKWDFTCEHGDFVIGGPGPDGPRRNITQLLANEGDVECEIHNGSNVLVGIKRASSR